MDLKPSKWWSEIKHNRKKILISIFFLLISISLIFLSGDYVEDYTNSVVVPDLILDHVGPYNLSFLFIWLFVIVIILFFLYPLISKPSELPYVINMFSLFYVVRSGFIIFTHLRAPHDAIQFASSGILSSLIQPLSFSNDLFFSGHAGLPFLGFLIHRDHKGLRYFMLFSSIILGITVLLMHVHYSIDVFSAFFITYGIYKIGNRFIRK